MNKMLLNDEQRLVFHSVFNEWLTIASEADYQALCDAREQFAPNMVCSAIRLVMGCLENPELIQVFPKSLQKLLQDRNWPLVCAGEKSAAA